MGSLSFMLPVEKFKRNGTHMYLPFQKFDLNPQFLHDSDIVVFCVGHLFYCEAFEFEIYCSENLTQSDLTGLSIFFFF